MDTIIVPANLPIDVPVVLGYGLNIFLYGILIVQAFIYYTRFTKDSKWLRFYTLLIFVLETISVAVVMYEMIEGSKIHCLSCLPLAWQKSWALGWSFRVMSALTGLISLLVHGFYCWRIYILSGYWYIPVFVLLSSLLQCIFLCVGIMSWTVVKNPTLVGNVWGIASLVCDFVITIETTRLLFRRKNEVSVADTNSLITRLIRFTCENLAVATGAMLLRFLLAQYDTTTDVIVSVSEHEIVLSQWQFSPSIAQLSVCYGLSMLYANCLLATLNARLVISGGTRLEAVSTILFDRSELRTKEESVESQSV
ncbi:hypothetical protein OG21DRAFT_1515598 [Imleria badia]|nr:hypothetical protein OG21DRAFT_1515598 [Imleria badia]